MEVRTLSQAQFRNLALSASREAAVMDSPFGKSVAAFLDGQIVFLGFGDCEAELKARFPFDFRFVEESEACQWKSRIFGSSDLLKVLVLGTPFQVTVWMAMLEIPTGSTVTYSELAARIGRPRSVRSVATAVGRNPVAFLIPCHRVVSRSGNPYLYHWGMDFKQRIMASEML